MWSSKLACRHSAIRKLYIKDVYGTQVKRDAGMSKQKAKGTRMETGLVRYLTRNMIDSDGIHRAALAGNADEGDVHGIRKGSLVGIAEVKNHKHITPGLVAEWCNETLRERENAHADFAVLVMHRNGCDQTGSSRSYGRNIVQLTMRDLMSVSGVEQKEESADGSTRRTIDADDVWVSIDVDTLVMLLNSSVSTENG